ncbi:MAG: GDSL family lipase [Sphingobacteriaceae bacterium]|nr:MAG: GDSL family lipase [Sphingobacteriaceae bacterium]
MIQLLKKLIPAGLLIYVFFGQLSYSQPQILEKPDTLMAERLKPYGRYVLKTKFGLELISSAVHFGFSFTGEKCTIYAFLPGEKDHNYLQYVLDGVYQKRLRVEGKTSSPITIKTAGPGKHSIWIYKATEATTGPIFIAKVLAPGVKVLPAPKAPLIEFIGNSITCGAAADTADVPCGMGMYQDHHNAYMAYGPRLARILKVSFLMSSVSGIGIYRTWNAESPSMPQVYENIDFQRDNSRRWNFATYTPMIVSIALGTNDLSLGDGKSSRASFDENVFISSYIRFVRLVKSKYPKAKIALLSSPMVKGSARTTLEKCLNQIKKETDSKYPSDIPVSTFFFEPMEAHGCDGHPSVEDHRILAEQLTPFFKKLLR